MITTIALIRSLPDGEQYAATREYASGALISASGALYWGDIPEDAGKRAAWLESVLANQTTAELEDTAADLEAGGYRVVWDARGPEYTT